MATTDYLIIGFFLLAFHKEIARAVIFIFERVNHPASSEVQ
jgi:hypothetical protein